MKLQKIILIEATLRCVSGLHIGGGDTEMHIGGLDNTVIKNPLTQRPYIPGSSLKGKIRSLLEWKSGAVREKPLSWSDYQTTQSVDVLNILKLFGVAGSEQLTNEDLALVGPSRLSFWDCDLDPEWTKEIQDENMLTTEAKSENTINRISGTADNPRQTERVVAGAPFKFTLSLKVLDDDTEELQRTVLAGMKLLERDSLGGSGSRGYGKVSFEQVKVDGKDFQKEFDAIDPFLA